MLILPRISQKHNCYLITFFLHRYVKSKSHTPSYCNFLLCLQISMFRLFFQFLLYLIVLYLRSSEITAPLKNLLRLFWLCIFPIFLMKHSFCDCTVSLPIFSPQLLTIFNFLANFSPVCKPGTIWGYYGSCKLHDEN